jgi:hypothetical protein
MVVFSFFFWKKQLSEMLSGRPSELWFLVKFLSLTIGPHTYQRQASLIIFYPLLS